MQGPLLVGAGLEAQDAGCFAFSAGVVTTISLCKGESIQSFQKVNGGRRKPSIKTHASGGVRQFLHAKRRTSLQEMTEPGCPYVRAPRLCSPIGSA